jgi:hypothetical protein
MGPEAPGTDDDLIVRIDAPSSDPDGDPVTYRYTWTRDGVPVEHLSTDTVPAAETTKGERWEVVVTPNDGQDDGNPSTSWTMVGNTPPVVEVRLEPEAPVTTDALVTTSATFDADGDTVSLVYAWTRDDVAQPTESATLDAGSTASGEVWAVTVTPSDGESVGEPASAEVRIGNSPPLVVSVTLEPEAPFVNEPVTAIVTTYDADGEPVENTYTWYVDGVLAQSGSSDTLPAGSFAKHQRINVEVVPTDAEARGEAFLSADAIALNSPPTVVSAQIAPDPAYEGSTLACVPGGASDLDGDTLTWGYAWTLGGTRVATTETLDGASFSKGDVVGCSATPHDGEADGVTVSSAASTIANTPPVLTGLTLSTYAPTEQDTLSVTLGTTQDDDDDPISVRYAWYVNGIVVSTSSTLLPNRFMKGDSITLVVTPNDGVEDGAPVTSPVATAANSPPTLTALAWSASVVRTDDTIEVTASADDPDGDRVSFTYDWYVDGVVKGSYLSPQLDGSLYFDKGQTLYVVVTPTDGVDDGAPHTSDALVVANSAPTVPSIALSPANPAAGDVLTCTVRTAATDADGDEPRYLFSWQADGMAFSDATDGANESTVAAEDVVGAAAWTCVVTATDGDDVSAAVTASVEVCPDEDGDGATDIDCGGEDCRDDDPALHPYDSDADGTSDACGWRDLAVFGGQACAIDSDEGLVCWGASSPVTPDPAAAYAEISGFYGSACALLTDGTVSCWGGAAVGAAYGPPSAVTFEDIAIGTQMSVGLTTDGRVFAWGWNTYSSVASTVGTDGASAAANYHAACWLDQDGLAYCQPSASTIGFAPDNSDAPYAAIAIGNGHGCVLRASDGTPLCYGNDYYGQLDAPAEALTTVVAGLETTCGLREDGTATCWGNDDLGATDAPAGVSFERLAVGYDGNYGSSTFCGVTTDQSVACWGTGSGTLERE